MFFFTDAGLLAARDGVRGLTTAAAIWVSAVVGMAFSALPGPRG